MIKPRFAIAALLPLLLTACGTEQEALQPNIVLIVADDLGYSDIGSFGGEIRTPNLDSLAAHGLRLTNFHTAPTCGPTRAMLMTGIDSHPVGMATNAATLRRLTYLQGRSGYEGHLNERAVTVATLLQDAGYQTYLSGKWDLGGNEGSRPIDRGFDKSFALATGGASHFSDAEGALQSDGGANYIEDERVVDELPNDFYSSRFYADRAMEYIESGDPAKPFFAYVAFTAPHWPLQVPDDWLDRYRGQYDGGWQQLAESRLERQLELGLIDSVPGYSPLRGVREWDSLPAEERQLRAREMEIYAAMVEYMDWQIGRLIEYVESLPSDRETLIIFLADNGPEGNAIDRIGNNAAWIEERFNNDLDNMGRRDSYLWTGPGWAQASAQPHRLYKSFVAEGGISAPSIIYLSGSTPEVHTSDALVRVSDVPATILDAAGISHPGARYKGRDILPMEGRSALPVFFSAADSIHEGEALGWELYGNRALIRDNWKAMLIWPPYGDGQWKLFDLSADPLEERDLGAEHPELLDELIGEWNAYAEDKGIYLFEEDSGYGRY